MCTHRGYGCSRLAPSTYAYVGSSTDPMMLTPRSIHFGTAGACAALAATGFRGRQTVVGIDLGTTFSVIGVNEVQE